MTPDNPPSTTPTLTELIDNPALLSEETLPRLQAIVDERPEYQAARMLLVQNLYLLHHPGFTAQLRKAALMLPHPEGLYQLIEPQLMPETLRKQDAHTPPTGRTDALIDQFLAGNTQAEAPTPTSAPNALPSLSDVTSDYAAFLALQPDQPNDEETTEEMARKAQLIEQFIQQTKGQQRYQLPELPDEETNS